MPPKRAMSAARRLQVAKQPYRTHPREANICRPPARRMLCLSSRICASDGPTCPKSRAELPPQDGM
eukprot:6062795-Pyramimonas_sp.AAC.2